jgi:hypothetical protein
MQDEQLEQLTVNEELTQDTTEEVTEETTEEITEEVNVEDLIREETDSQLESVATRKFPKITAERLFIAASLVISILSLTLYARRPEPASWQRSIIVEENEAYSEFGNLIHNELAFELGDKVNLRRINIRIIDAIDKVSAEIVFFPQESIRSFAQDCRTVLDVMSRQDLIYDEITFIAQDTLTHIRADLSGVFNMDITVEEIMAITFYFGEIEIIEDIQDIHL